MPLTPKQERFVAEYLVDLNATQAAIRAGYSPKGATVTGSKLLANPKVGAAVAAGKAQQLEKADLTATMVLEAIRRQVVGDVRQLFDTHGNLRAITDLTEEQAALIAGMEVVKRNLTAGDGEVDTIIKVKLTDRGRYVEMAAKHFGLLIERVEVTGDEAIVARLQAARKRVGK